MNKRNPMLKSLIVFIILSFVIMATLPSASFASSEPQMGHPTAANTFIDALIYRPIGLVCIPVGAVLFVVSLPFSATGHNVGESFHNLVVAPFDFTFDRPLGDI